MVRSTPAVKKHANTTAEGSLLFGIDGGSRNINETIKKFAKSGFKVPSFKKKATSSTDKKAQISSSSVGWVTNRILKQQQSKFQRLSAALQSPFQKINYRKKHKNYTNKSSDLSNVTSFKSKSLDFDAKTGIPIVVHKVSKRNKKKVKRDQRRQLLIQRLDKQLDPMTKQKEEEEDEKEKLNDDQSVDSPKKLIDSKRERKEHKSKDDHTPTKSTRRSGKAIRNQMEKDRRRMRSLFRNKEFDDNPLEFIRKKTEHRTKEMEVVVRDFMADKGSEKRNGNINKRIRSRDAEKGKSEFYQRLQAKLKGDKNKRTFGHSTLSEEAVKEKITEQLRLGKENKLKGVKGVKKVLKRKEKRKLKKKETSRKLRKKIRQKMSQFAKDTQKKRKWRI